jgi:tetratricopeptide (TPR) repeat protein
MAAPVPAGAVFDTDATVRTTPPAQPAVAADHTVRTLPVLPVPAKPRRSHPLLGCVAVFLLIPLLILAVYFFIQVNFWNNAEKLKTDLQSERITNLDEAWTEYETLNKRSHLSVLLWGAERALRKRLVAAADEIISEYRDSDAPAVFEPQWIQARNNLARALELSPDDSGIQGRLRLCEGHIDRFEANNARGPTRQKRLNAALGKFEEAAALLKHSPDPYLGLASLYDYQLEDVDKAEDALQKAAHYGHPAGKRDTAQLADAYRHRAERMWRQSRGLTHEPEQERNFLDRAKQDYAHAEDLYQRAGLFGDSVRNRLQAVHGEQRVEQRLSELQGSPVSQ